MLDVTAYHEAGHAAMAVTLGAELRSLTIEPDWDDGPARHGDTQLLWEVSRYTPAELARNGALVALAGPVAEMIYLGEPYHPGFVAEWADDWRLAWQAAAPLVADKLGRLALLEQFTRELRAMLQRDTMWAAVAALADELQAHETLDGEQVVDVLQTWLP